VGEQIFQPPAQILCHAFSIREEGRLGTL